MSGVIFLVATGVTVWQALTRVAFFFAGLRRTLTRRHDLLQTALRPGTLLLVPEIYLFAAASMVLFYDPLLVHATRGSLPAHRVRRHGHASQCCGIAGSSPSDSSSSSAPACPVLSFCCRY